jgi:hypothetical protein
MPFEDDIRHTLDVSINKNLVIHMIQEHYDGPEEFEILEQLLHEMCLNIEAEIEKKLIDCKDVNLYSIILDAFSELHEFSNLE